MTLPFAWSNLRNAPNGIPASVWSRMHFDPARPDVSGFAPMQRARTQIVHAGATSRLCFAVSHEGRGLRLTNQERCQRDLPAGASIPAWAYNRDPMRR